MKWTASAAMELERPSLSSTDTLRKAVRPPTHRSARKPIPAAEYRTTRCTVTSLDRIA